MTKKETFIIFGSVMSDIESVIYKMFKAYDMRGTVPELTSEVYYYSGIALVEEILKKENLATQVCMVRDARATSNEFYAAFAKGVEDAGGEVIPLGEGSSDFLYAACLLFDKPGVMVTASHNPAEYNGFKIVKNTPEMVGLDSGLDVIRDFVIQKMIDEDVDLDKLKKVKDDEEAKKKVLDFILNKFKEIGSIEEVDAKLKEEGRVLKVIVDAGNGMGGSLMPDVVKLYKNIDFVPLYWEPDGTFPNHQADPTVDENLKDLKGVMEQLGADLGVGLDGDADRSVVVDENLQPLQGDYLVAEIAKYMIRYAKDNPQAGLNPVVVYPQPNSRCIPESVLEMDGIPVPTKQGHTFIKREMKKYNAVYGGENSGHHYYGAFGCMDSGILNMVVVLKMLVLGGKKASALACELKEKYYISGWQNYETTEEITMESVRKIIKDNYKDAAISEIDGIIVTYPDWRFCIRASNTEPLLRVLVESRQDNIKTKLKEVLTVIGL